jgi:selenocysteine lyase/cysteine desulfurase
MFFWIKYDLINKVCYADYTASGRPLSFIEDYLKDKVLSNYANTHSTGTNTAAQTTKLRDEARY